MKTLLVIPSITKPSLDAAVASDQHPTMDYDALAQELRSVPGSQVDVLDYTSVELDQDPAVRCVRKVAGLNAALALMAFQRRAEYDTIFTNAENVALPLALMLKTVSNRPRHVTIGHRLSAPKKKLFYRWLQVHREMDAIFVYASTQRDFAHEALGIPREKLRLIRFHADHRFYRPLAQRRVREEQICGVGLEWRDYPTLIDAVTDQPHLSVRLAAASPWSKNANETEARTLPAHVDARKYDYNSLRDLYAESAIVVVPLYENDFQAGITTILEAMAMGKPVIVTRTTGQSDVVIDGATGLYVQAGDIHAWKDAIERLRKDPALRAQLGHQARRWVEEHATLDRWVEQVTAALRDAPATVSSGAPQHAAADSAMVCRLSLATGAAPALHPTEFAPKRLRLLSGASG